MPGDRKEERVANWLLDRFAATPHTQRHKVEMESPSCQGRRVDRTCRARILSGAH
jgi:hypothetical protein